MNELLKRRIRASGYTFTEAAAVAGVSSSCLSNKLAGRHRFSAEEAVKLGRFLGLDMDQMAACFLEEGK